MKLVFLHGLGQSAESWKEVRNLLTDYPSEAIELFPSTVSNYQQAKERVYQHLAQETEPFILVGLSLGAALALELSSYDLPNLQGLVLSGCPLKLAGNILFKIQLMIFNLLPKTGLAFDVIGTDGQLVEDSNAAQWLLEHAPDYGFVVRYPRGKESITGYMHEEWHLRYIGKEAKDIAASGLTLEEYYGFDGGDYLD